MPSDFVKEKIEETLVKAGLKREIAADLSMSFQKDTQADRQSQQDPTDNNSS
jgi:hypothetical protein